MKYPTVEMMWYPNCSFTMNRTVHKIDTAISHYLPAYIIDFFARITGKRVKWVSQFNHQRTCLLNSNLNCVIWTFKVRLYDRAHRAISCLDFFTTHQWRFISENPIRLLDHLSNGDKQTFYFDVRGIDWNSYIETYILGARRFILKDDPSTIPAARKNLNR